MKVELLKTDGTREEHEITARGSHARMQACYRLAGCDTFDCVNLRNGLIMMVDDNGWECETVDHGNGQIEMKPVRALKPINVEATKLYHSICRPGTTHPIVGDVVIARDEDFA